MALVLVETVKFGGAKSRHVFEDSEESNSEEELGEADKAELKDLPKSIALIAMRFKKFNKRTRWKHRGAAKAFLKKYDREREGKAKMVCFNCEKLGHFALECR